MLNVLVVDDDPLILLNYTAHMLEDLGHQMTKARHLMTSRASWAPVMCGIA